MDKLVVLVLIIIWSTSLRNNAEKLELPNSFKFQRQMINGTFQIPSLGNPFTNIRLLPRTDFTLLEKYKLPKCHFAGSVILMLLSFFNMQAGCFNNPTVSNAVKECLLEAPKFPPLPTIANPAKFLPKVRKKRQEKPNEPKDLLQLFQNEINYFLKFVIPFFPDDIQMSTNALTIRELIINPTAALEIMETFIGEDYANKFFPGSAEWRDVFKHKYICTDVCVFRKLGWADNFDDFIFPVIQQVYPEVINGDNIGEIEQCFETAVDGRACPIGGDCSRYSAAGACLMRTVLKYCKHGPWARPERSAAGLGESPDYYPDPIPPEEIPDIIPQVPPPPVQPPPEEIPDIIPAVPPPPVHPPPLYPPPVYPPPVHPPPVYPPPVYLPPVFPPPEHPPPVHQPQGHSHTFHRSFSRSHSRSQTHFHTGSSGHNGYLH